MDFPNCSVPLLSTLMNCGLPDVGNYFSVAVSFIDSVKCNTDLSTKSHTY